MNEREAYKFVDAEMEKYAKKRKHADMCVAFHERLLQLVKQYHEFAPSPESVALLGEIEKANQ